ncbi:MAG: hypothetical protein KAT34_06945 [Candidatus Aminicenantes bacterium]|nr:hypothetical protein [Candidatus Aminicenantes bacterium]
MKRKNSEDSGLEKFTKFTTIVANIMVIVIVGIGISQYFQAKNLEKKRVAVDVVYRDIEFLKAFARLKTSAKSIGEANLEEILVSVYGAGDNDNNKKLMTYDINYILNTYKYIWILYDNNLADRNTLEQGVCPEAKIFLDIFDKLKRHLKTRWDIVCIQRLAKICKCRIKSS